MTRYIVGTAGDIPPGERKIVSVDGREIGVFNVDGEFYAVRNSCPHQGGPLCLGLVVGSVPASPPGVYDHRRTKEILQCPWHQWEFDIRTGKSWFDPEKVKTRSYPTCVEKGSAITDEPQLTVEVYRVSVDDDYVVVEVS